MKLLLLLLLLLLALTAGLLYPIANSYTNYFGEGGVFELDLGDSEIHLTPREEREKKLLEEKLKKKGNK